MFLSYIDPLAGGLFVQLVLGGIAGAVLFLKYQGRRLLALFGFRKEENSSSDDS